MDTNALLTCTVELALSLLEKRAAFLPFCRAVDDEAGSIIYTAASDASFSPAQAFASVRAQVLRDIRAGRLRLLAFCFDGTVTLTAPSETLSAIEVEIHELNGLSAVHHFTWVLAGKNVSVLDHYQGPIVNNIFALRHNSEAADLA